MDMVRLAATSRRPAPPGVEGADTPSGSEALPIPWPVGTALQVAAASVVLALPTCRRSIFVKGWAPSVLNCVASGCGTGPAVLRRALNINEPMVLVA